MLRGIGGGGGATLGANTFTGAQTNSTNSALSAPADTLTGTWITGGSATTTKPHFLIEPSGTTSTGWSTSGTGIGVNAASGFTGNILDLQVNGVSRLKYNPSGGQLTITDPTASSKALDIFTGTYGSAPGQQVTFNYAARGIFAIWGNNVTDESLMAFGSGGFSWSAGANNAPDLFLRRDAANVLAQRNSTNAQTFRVYNTYTDASNYERAALSWSSNVAYLKAENAGTGSARLMIPVTGSTTVAGLPSASTAGAGARAFVTDATATTYLSTAAGGGANKVPVVSDGTNWLIG